MSAAARTREWVDPEDIDLGPPAPGVYVPPPATNGAHRRDPGPDTTKPLDGAPKAEVTPSADPAPHTWQPCNLAELGDSPAPKPTLSGVGYPGTLTIVYSEPDGLKTWLELIVGLEAIRAGRSVAWVDFEMDGRSILARLRDLGATDDELERFLYIAPAERLTDAAIVADVAALMRDHNPAVVVIDAMAGCLALHGLSQNDADDIELLYSILLRPFRVGDTALRLIDHVTKDRETRGRWPTGSQRKLGAADVGLSLDVIHSFTRGHTGLARIRVQKDRLGGMARPCCAELTLASNPETGAITWSLRTPSATDDQNPENPWRPTAIMEKVSRYLAEHDEPISRNTIEKAKLGKQATYVRDAIDALVADGYATETAGPRGSRLYQTLKPFTSSDLVPPRPDEDTSTSSDLVPSLQGTRSSDEDEVERLFATYSDEVT